MYPYPSQNSQIDLFPCRPFRTKWHAAAYFHEFGFDVRPAEYVGRPDDPNSCGGRSLCEKIRYWQAHPFARMRLSFPDGLIFEVANLAAAHRLMASFREQPRLHITDGARHFIFCRVDWSDRLHLKTAYRSARSSIILPPVSSLIFIRREAESAKHLSVLSTQDVERTTLHSRKAAH